MIPGGWEWIVIVIVVLVLFGAKRIPEMGRSLGQGIRGFKKELGGKGDGDDEDDAGSSNATAEESEPKA